ncbi:hypothetical protein N6L26_01180 [Qipengyuania sp. SS22]|uniref:hypothetical protein n=1 Tax=Qipengyuania sp. SS22 TaxID=2979461 RepID=UPI0021E5F32E|nr:hypothetical protein [Qipengyuania sp. SS22]UYH55213.1 hypothetical protein N6L26_01180 [Qipengyuania sp. SS22]
MRILVAGAAAIVLATGGAYAAPGKGQGNDKRNNDRAAAQLERGEPETRRANSIRQRAKPSTERRDNRTPDAPIARDRSSGARAFLDRDRNRALIAGCPPGLARRTTDCVSADQAGASRVSNQRWNGYDYDLGLFGLSHYAAGRYYYDDGYLLRRTDEGGVAGYVPLLGGALAIGNVWPSTYESYAVPDYYVDYYDLGPVSSYRYAEHILYRVDPEDFTITSVAGLLTGDTFTVGQAVPAGYDVYNVPYSYRERYADTADAWYRYSDGHVYRIDPETQLVAAVIDLLV